MNERHTPKHMNTILTKLQYKAQDPVLLLQSPPEFAAVAKEWKALAALHTMIDKKSTYAFAMAFVQSPADVKKHVTPLLSCLGDDAMLWMAYPKKTSKKYSAGINRDEGWDLLGKHGYETVRAVAIDEDWSGLRFRKTVNIPSLTRRQGMALSKEGKVKTGNKNQTAARKK
jgi:hypothetical protein